MPPGPALEMLEMASGGYNYHHDVTGPPLEYRFDLVFPLLVIAAYLISLLAILFAISILIQVSLPHHDADSKGHWVVHQGSELTLLLIMRAIETA